MKIIKHVPTFQVKRCFVVSNLMTKRVSKNKKKIVEPKEHFRMRLDKVKKKVMEMPQKKLDYIIGHGYQKRLNSYNSCKWMLVELSIDEMGVWKRAGELPLRWTNKTLRITADKVRRALNRRNGFKHKRIRAVRSIKGILSTSIDIIQSDMYLFPITFKGGIGTRGRRRLKYKVHADIDDGCMRSIALAVSGRDRITVYYGVIRNNI